MSTRYTGELPMDFEWNNGTGAIDGRSPFAQVSSNAQRFPPSSPSKKRDYSTHNSSPSKSRTMGASSSKPLPPKPASFNALFSTPRKPRPEVDDSSAGETPKSPERNGDSDATPEIVNSRSAMAVFDQASAPTMAGAERERASPVKERPQPERRESVLGRLISKTKRIYSPGRGEVPRSEHPGAIEKKRSTRRKREVDRRVARRRRHSMSDSGEDQDRPPRSPRKRSGQQPPDEKEPHWISSLFTFIGQHPSVPHILSYYAQFIFNAFLLGCCGYLIYCFWSAVSSDVDKRQYEAMAGVLADMAVCASDYDKNRCDPRTRVPAMEAACEGWARCMKQDPTKVGRAKVSATTFAEIYNSFVEPISWKAMVFTTVLVFGCFGISNFVRSHFTSLRQHDDQLENDEDSADNFYTKAFGFFRQKAQQFHPQPGYGYGYGYNGPPPPTPQRSFSGQDGTFYAGTPWHMPPQQMGFEPQPSGGYGAIEGQGSPVRRLAYN